VPAWIFANFVVVVMGKLFFTPVDFVPDAFMEEVEEGTGYVRDTYEPNCQFKIPGNQVDEGGIGNQDDAAVGEGFYNRTRMVFLEGH
jgi:hypothetical protein